MNVNIIIDQLAVHPDQIIHHYDYLINNNNQQDNNHLLLSDLCSSTIHQFTTTTNTSTIQLWIQLTLRLFNTTTSTTTTSTTTTTTTSTNKRFKHSSQQLHDCSTLKRNAIQAISSLLNLKLSNHWSHNDISTLIHNISKFINDLWQINDLKSAFWKDPALKRPVFSLYAQCIVVYGLDAQSSLEQNMKFFDFLAEPTAEFLAFLVSEHNHTLLLTSMLTRIGQGSVFGGDHSSSDIIKEPSFSYNPKHTKSISLFLTTVSCLVPQIVSKSLVYLQDQLDHSEYSLRCAVLHCIATSIQILFADNNDKMDQHALQDRVSSLFDIIQDRFRDVHAMVRKKVLVIIGELTDYKYFYAQFPLVWLRLVDLTVGRLQDKNQPVRLAAIRTLTLFLVRNPFTLHQGKSLDLPQVLEPLAIDAKQNIVSLVEQLELDPDASVDPNELNLLELRNKYFTHAVHFAQTMDSRASPVLLHLLASKSKPEILDAMEFFVEAYGLALCSSVRGLKQMWMLVFNVRNAEFVKDVHAKLVDCFRAVYLVPEDDGADVVDFAVKNLIMLTYNASLADLTCLETLVGMCVSQSSANQWMETNKIVDLLWKTVLLPTAVPARQRQGAALVLAWIYRAVPDLLSTDQLLVQVVQVLTTYRSDALLMRSCLLILHHLPTRLPCTHDLFKIMSAWLISPTTTGQQVVDHWYPMAQQVVCTVFKICQQPVLVLDHVLQVHARALLNPDASVPTEHVCRFLFVLGHVAVQVLVFIESVEALVKVRQSAAATNVWTPRSKTARGRTVARKSTTPTTTPPSSSSDNDDGNENENNMDGVVGSIEDIVADNFSQIRELELMQGVHGLLAVFAPMVVDLVGSPTTPLRVRQFAAVALAQMMCVSQDFCQQQLPLLLAVLDHPSSPPVLKSNLLIAMGDLIVSFSTVIDDHASVLFDALKADQPILVKKNALMVLLHLILNGVVKVKGHLSGLAMCLEDKDPRIAGLTRLFLAELAGKEHALFNNLSDALSHLLVFHDHDAEHVTRVKRVLKYLFAFISKDKQVDAVIDKLCMKLKHATTVTESRVIAFALTLLPWEAGPEHKCRKLTDAFQPALAEKVAGDRDVLDDVMSIAARLRKAAATAAAAGATVAAVDEFVACITRARDGAGAPLAAEQADHGSDTPQGHEQRDCSPSPPTVAPSGQRNRRITKPSRTRRGAGGRKGGKGGRFDASDSE